MSLGPLSCGAHCATCPFAKDGKPERPVAGEGPGNPLAIVLGEGPGDQEHEQRRPWVGPTGQALRGELVRAGLDPRTLFLGNVTACRPPPKFTRREKEVGMRKAAIACRPFLAAQLAALAPRPRPTLLLGSHAFTAIIGKMRKGGMKKTRGFVRPGAVLGPTVLSPAIASWHPTYAVFRNPYELWPFRVDVGKLARAVSNTLRPEPTVNIKPTVEQLHAIPQPLGSWPLAVSVDIETAPDHPSRPWTGKDPTRARLKTIAFGNADHAVAFQWGKDARLTKHARDILLDPNITKVFQNGFWFDRPVLRLRADIDIPESQIEDTRDAWKALYGTSRLDLGHMATIASDPAPWKENEEEEGLDGKGEDDDEKGIVFGRSIPALLHYNGLDASQQFRVMQHCVTRPQWRTERLQRTYELLKDGSICASEMHESGFPIHQENRTKLARRLASMHARRAAILVKHVGIPGFRCNPNHMRALIYKRHELKPSLKRGLPDGIARFALDDPYDDRFWNDDHTALSVDQQALLLLYVDPATPDALRPIIDLYWQAYAPRMLKSTFVQSKKVDKAIGEDGALHAGWNSNGPDTYRWACSNPNLMNLSRERDD